MTTDGLPSLGSDRFEPTVFVAEGGMANVYRAWDHALEEWCAIKVLKPKYATNDKDRERFLLEGRTLLQLSHRNIVSARHLSKDGSCPYLAMEIADAGSLEDHLRTHGHLPPRMATDVAIQVSKGVAASHAMGVIHRDIKPHNILVNRMGICKLSDFGIAKLLDSHGFDELPNKTPPTPTVNAMGTLGYMAPEQRSDPLLMDVRTDVYGIGASLFALVTGNVVNNLFLADREPHLIEAVPEALRPIVLCATAYKPENRFESARELAAALFECRSALPHDPKDAPRLADNVPPEPEAPAKLDTLRSSQSVEPPPLPPLPQQRTTTVPDTAVRHETPPQTNRPPIPSSHDLTDHAPDISRHPPVGVFLHTYCRIQRTGLL